MCVCVHVYSISNALLSRCCQHVIHLCHLRREFIWSDGDGFKKFPGSFLNLMQPLCAFSLFVSSHPSQSVWFKSMNQHKWFILRHKQPAYIFPKYWNSRKRLWLCTVYVQDMIIHWPSEAYITYKWRLLKTELIGWFYAIWGIKESKRSGNERLLASDSWNYC